MTDERTSSSLGRKCVGCVCVGVCVWGVAEEKVCSVCVFVGGGWVAEGKVCSVQNPRKSVEEIKAHSARRRLKHIKL